MMDKLCHAANLPAASLFPFRISRTSMVTCAVANLSDQVSSAEHTSELLDAASAAMMSRDQLGLRLS